VVLAGATIVSVKWIRVRQSLLLYAATYVGIFLVLASSVYTAYSHPATTFSPAAMGWYLGIASFALLIGGVGIALRHTPYQRLIPRLHLVSAFVLWVGVVIGGTLSRDVAAQYVLLLLEAATLFLLLTLVAHRIRKAFAPQTPGRWLTGVSLIMGSGVVIITPTMLNYSLGVSGATAVFTAGIGHALIIGAGFALILMALCYIPLGRPRLIADRTFSVGPLVFSTPESPDDCSLIELTERLVTEQRQLLFKRGMWLHYRNHLVQGNGLISTKPKALEELMTTLLEFAAHQNQSKAVSVKLYNDTRHSYLHLVIDYIVNTHKKSDFKAPVEAAAALGGALTINRDDRTTELVLSFPLQW